MPILLLLIPLFAVFLFLKPKKADLSDFYVGGSENTHDGTGYGVPTINQTKADSLAIQLYNEMQSMFTSENSVMNLLSGLTEYDYIMIFKSFGTPKRDPIFAGGSVLLGNPYNLTEWLSIEITSSKNVNKLKALFPNYF